MINMDEALKKLCTRLPTNCNEDTKGARRSFHYFLASVRVHANGKLQRARKRTSR